MSAHPHIHFKRRILGVILLEWDYNFGKRESYDFFLELTIIYFIMKALEVFHLQSLQGSVELLVKALETDRH